LFVVASCDDNIGPAPSVSWPATAPRETNFLVSDVKRGMRANTSLLAIEFEITRRPDAGSPISATPFPNSIARTGVLRRKPASMSRADPEKSDVQ
jgi:hypothetical protein